MSQERQKPSLREKVAMLSGASARSTSGDACALKRSCSHCQSKGFQLGVLGAYLQAEVCSCVVDCKECYGQARYLSHGMLKTCKHPSPLRIVNTYNDAKISSHYLTASLKGFNNFSGNGRATLEQVQKWLRGFLTPNSTKAGLILSGPVGVGKTYLLVAVAKALIESGVQVKYVDFHRLLSVIRAAYTDKKSEEEILNPLINSEVLLIDELGKGRNSDWEQEKLDQIVMGRYSQNKIIVASTNYSLKDEVNIQSIYNVDLEQNGATARGSFNPDQFESLEARIGKRIFSRLFETSMLVELNGVDFRRQNRRVDRPNEAKV